MDVYRALNADVPQLLFTVMHQAGPVVPEEDFTRTVTALHMDIRQQAQAMGEELHRWLGQGKVQEALERDYGRLASRVGTESLLGMQGSGEEVFVEEGPVDPDLAKCFVDGREYLTSLGFKPGQGPLHEAWLLFRSSIHYDMLEHAVRDRIGIYKSSHGDHIAYVGRVSFGTYNLIYQLGEGLTADLADDRVTQEVTFVFGKGPVQYSPFRQEVSAMLEYVGEQTNLIHASFWQRKLGLGTGKEFVLRLRLPAGEEALREVLGVIASAGRVGKETIVKRSKLLLGRRVL